MRKIVLPLLLILFVNSSRAEIWFDLGIKGAYAPGMFINKNVFGTSAQNLSYNHGFFAGGKIGINFGLSHCLTVDGLLSQTRQTLNSISGTSSTVTLRSFDLPIMYRNNTDEGGYAEIGPQLSVVMSADRTDNLGKNDVKSSFAASKWGVAFGFGQYIGGGDAFGFNIGFRFAYTLSDIITSSAGNASTDPIYQPITAEEISSYNYAKSSRLYVGIALEADFNLGYFAKGASCTKRTKFRMF